MSARPIDSIVDLKLIPEPHFTWPLITPQVEKAVIDQLHKSISIYDRSGVFAEFESRLEAYFGVKHALLFNSGTSALHAMYFALDASPGAEVICPTYTFAATASPLLQLGLRPIFVDSDEYGNIDPTEIEKALTARTCAIAITHLWGMPCQMSEICELSARFGIPLLEDISHAFGASYRGNKVGTFGLAAALSLQAQKVLTGGEGGVLLTNDDETFYRALALGHYNKRCKAEIPTSHPLAEIAVTGLGLKLRAHPLGIAIANEQLNGIDEVVAARHHTASFMRERMRNSLAIDCPTLSDDVRPSWYSFTFSIKPHLDHSQSSCDEFLRKLHLAGCFAVDRPGSTAPLATFAMFRDWPRYSKFESVGELERCTSLRADSLHGRSFKVPVWHRQEDMPIVEAYCNAIVEIAKSHFL